MKIKNYEEIERKMVKVRKIKKETNLFIGEKDYYLEQIGDKTWRYHWFKKETE